MAIDNAARNGGIQVIARAASVLRVLAANNDGLSLGQIAQRVDLPRSTVQRIVAALADEHLVASEDGDGGFRLGPELHKLAQASSNGAFEQLREVMMQVAEQTGETVDLAVLDGDRMRFVDQIVGPHRLRTVSSIGERFPLATTANGKAALACLESDVASRLIKAELGITTTRSKIVTRVLDEVAAIRDGSLARDVDEHTDGISALGYAVKGPYGEVHALSIPVPSSRFERIEDRLAKVLQASRGRLVELHGGVGDGTRGVSEAPRLRRRTG